MEAIFLPKDKFDFDTCKKIQKLNNKQFSMITEELLSWLQDINWPIFPEIIKIFVKKQELSSKCKCNF